MASTMIQRTFVKEDDKKHSIRFKEHFEEGEEAALGTIYVKRSVLKTLDNEDGSKPIVVTLMVE